MTLQPVTDKSTPWTCGERPIFALQATNGDDVLFFASKQTYRVIRNGLVPFDKEFSLRHLGMAINRFGRLAGRMIHDGGANLRSLRPSRSRRGALVETADSTRKAPR